MRKNVEDARDIKDALRNGNLFLTLALVFFLAVFGAGAVLYAMARPHHWLRANGAKITITGDTIKESTAYYSSNKSMILLRVVHRDDSESLYVCSPAIRVVYVPDPGEFSFKDDGAFLKTNGVKGSDLRTGERPVISDTAFEFAAENGMRIRIDMGEPLKPDVPHNYF